MAEQTKHTAGPWRVVKRSNQTGIRSLSVATDKQQGGVWELASVAVITEQNAADARLIAAAPALLAALRDLLPIVADLDSMRESDEPEIPELTAARRAIAAATGAA